MWAVNYVLVSTFSFVMLIHNCDGFFLIISMKPFMNMKTQIIFGIGILVYSASHANFQARQMSNAGTFGGNNTNLVVLETLDNSGAILGTESVHITCGKLTGTGLIKGPNIHISTNEFAFTGTIDCGEQCTFVAQKEIAWDGFKRTGAGKYQLEVQPNAKIWQTPDSAFQEKPIALLADSWKDIKNSKLKETYKVCRVLVQIAVEKEYENSGSWEEIKKKVKEITWFLRIDHRFSRSPQQDLFNLLIQLPYKAMEQGK